jgi:hypothetical protein
MKIKITTNFTARFTIDSPHLDILVRKCATNEYDLDVTLKSTSKNDIYSFRISPKSWTGGDCRCTHLGGDTFDLVSNLIFEYETDFPRFLIQGLKEGAVEAYFTGLHVSKYAFINEERYNAFRMGDVTPVI